MIAFRKVLLSFVTAVSFFAAVGSVIAQEASPGLDDFYKLGPDSLVQEGVPKGTISDAQVLPLPSLSWNAAYLLGLCSSSIRSQGALQFDDLSGWSSVHEPRGWPASTGM